MGDYFLSFLKFPYFYKEFYLVPCLHCLLIVRVYILAKVTFFPIISFYLDYFNQFSIYLLSPFHIPETVLITGSEAVPVCHRLSILVGETVNLPK